MTTKLSSVAVGFLLAAILFGAGCSKEEKVTRALARGDKHLAAGLYDLAQAEYESALQMLPEDPKAVGRLGILCYHQGRIVPAYLLLQEALKGDPKSIELQLKFGLASQSLAKNADARMAARKILETQPANEEALLLLAETCMTTRDNEEARGIVEALRERNPDGPGYHIALGVLRLAQRDQAGAEVELRKALELNPKSSAAHSYLGSLFLARGESEQALGALKLAAEFEPLRSLRRLKYIDHLIRTGAGAEGRKLLGELTAKAPDYIPGLTLDMNLAYNERRYEESGAIAEKILIRDRTNHDALSQRAAVRIAQGDIEGAIGALKIMEDLYTQSALVKFRLANAHLRKGESALAEEYLNKAIVLSPDYDDAILLLVETSLQKGNVASAVSALTGLIKRQPRVARAYVLLAQAYQADSNLDECLNVLRAFTVAFPKYPEGPYFSAKVLTQLGKKEEARRALEQSVQAAPDYWPALEMLVNDDLLESRTGVAKQRVQGLMEKFPRQPVPLLLDAKVALQEGDESRAQSDLLKAIELAPNEPHAYVFLARIYLRSQQPQQAVETLAALAAKTNSASTFMQLGVLNGSLGNHEAARVAYEKALAVDPKFVPALNNLASILAINLGQIDKAQPLAEKARALAPTDAHVLDTLGWILFHKGQYEAALALIRSSSERMPNEPMIQYHLGMVHYRLGQEEQAGRVFRQVTASGVDSPVAKLVQEHLATLAIDGATAGADVRRDLENRLTRDPNDPVVLTRIAAIEARAGASAQAVAHYEAALKINPRAVPTLMALVELYSGPSSNSARALELARAAHALVPREGEIAWRLGRVAFRLGDFSWAAIVLRSAAGGLRDQPEVLFDLALAAYSIGRVPEAERALEDALAIPSFSKRRAEAVRFASMIASAVSPARTQAALSEARKILAAEPDYVPALMVSALAQELAKDFKGAKEIYDKVLALYPAFAPATRQLAILYADKLGDDKKAEELAVKARQMFQDDPELAYALGTISFRRGDHADAVRFLKLSARKRDRHAETFFYLGLAEFQLKNTAESRLQLQRALQLNLPPQEASEAKRVLEQLSRK